LRDCHVWLGAPERAQEHAERVVEQSATGSGVGRCLTRLAAAQIDRGLTAMQWREYGQAAARGLLALEADRSWPASWDDQSA
jgi:hypothetical protein